MFGAEELEMTIIHLIQKYEKNEHTTHEYKRGAVTSLREMLSNIQSVMEDEEEED